MVFNTTKNKLEETESWAMEEVPQEMRAPWVALGHNLLVLLRRRLDYADGIRAKKVGQQREVKVRKRGARVAAAARKVAAAHTLVPRAVPFN